MRRTPRLPLRLAAFAMLASVVAALALVAPTVVDRPSNTAAAATTPTLSVMGPSQLTAAQLVTYYNSVDHHTFPYRVVNLNIFTGTVTPVPLEDLANLFISEGARYNVRGDVAFAQSIIETAWFNFPDFGQVRQWNNNFAGIGACDSCDNGFQFPSLQDGVRAQIQLLRNYADINSRTTNIPDPPLPSLWGSTPQLAADNFNFFSHKGRAPYWIKPDCSSGCMGNGNWATSPAYSQTVTSVYRQMLTFFGRTISPESISDHYANLGGSGSVLGNPTGDEKAIPGGRMRTYQFGNIYWTPDTGASEVQGAILLKYLALGGPSSPLGFPLSDEAPTAVGGGSRFNSFQGGWIYWTPTIPAHEVHGEIAFLYGLMGGPSSALGFPVSDETATPGGAAGRFNDFQGGSIYWSQATGVREVHGAIGDLYRQLGGPASALGMPIDNEQSVPGGRASSFQGGQILWSPATGAHEVQGAIAFLYGLMGGPSSALGLPVTDESPTPGGAGRFNHFQGGSIYWSPTTGLNEVHGQIAQLYGALGGAGGFLGLPVTGEQAAGSGRASVFQGGEIFWSPATGPHEVHGAILGLYNALGGPASFLGFPVTNESVTPDGNGRYNHFQGGSIYWSAPTGAHEVHGAIRDLWASLGWEAGPLGYPTSNEMPSPDGAGRVNQFQGGPVFWTPIFGAFRA